MVFFVEVDIGGFIIVIFIKFILWFLAEFLIDFDEERIKLCAGVSLPADMVVELSADVFKVFKVFFFGYFFW